MEKLNNCNNEKQVVQSKSRQPINKSADMEKCAGCGGENPEFVLEETHLCFDCYKAEKYYWAKGSL
jgi:hypothetical protein